MKNILFYVIAAFSCSLGWCQDQLDTFLTKANSLPLGITFISPQTDPQGRRISSIEFHGPAGTRIYTRLLSSDAKTVQHFVDGSLIMESNHIDAENPNAIYKLKFANGRLISTHAHEKVIDIVENDVVTRSTKFGDRQLGDLVDVLSPERGIRDFRAAHIWDYLNIKACIQGKTPVYVAMAGGPAAYVLGHEPTCKTIHNPIYEMPDGTMGGGDIELNCPPVFSLNNGSPIEAIGTSDGSVYRIQMVALEDVGQIIAFQVFGEASPRLIYRDWRTPVEIELTGGTIIWRDGFDFTYSAPIAITNPGAATTAATYISGYPSMQQSISSAMPMRIIYRKEN